MSDLTFFDYDPLTQVTTYFESLPGDDFRLHYRQDVEPYINANKAKQNLGKDAWRSQGDMRLEASIPINVQYEWLQKYGIEVWNDDHIDDVVKKLNDPDWRYLKCAEVII